MNRNDGTDYGMWMNGGETRIRPRCVWRNKRGEREKQRGEGEIEIGEREK